MTTSISTIEKVFIKTGLISSVRSWNGSNMHEFHLHLPDVDFDSWRTTQSIKCRISALHYTDYTPTLWNSEERACTLYIDTSHAGKGSAWARAQKRGDALHYLKIEDASPFPVSEKHLVFLGDQTAIGHFCTIQQLASPDSKINGCVVFNDLVTSQGLPENCPWLPVKSVVNYESLYEYTKELLTKQNNHEGNCVFYVVGNAQLIVAIRRLLKAHGVDGSNIKSKGFWK